MPAVSKLPHLEDKERPSGLLLPQAARTDFLVVCSSWPEEGEEERPANLKRSSFTLLCLS